MAAVAAALWDLPQPLAHPRDLPQHLASSGEASCAHAPPILGHHWDASCRHAPLPRLPLTATDGNACCGGTTLALLGAFERVKAVELDEDRCADLVHNLRVLGYAPTPALPGDPECVPVPGLDDTEKGPVVLESAQGQEGCAPPGPIQGQEGAAAPMAGPPEMEEGAAVAELAERKTIDAPRPSGVGAGCGALAPASSMAQAGGRGAREVQVRGGLWRGGVWCSFQAGGRGA